MDLLQPYRGKYVNAASASSKLDINAIIAGCDAVDEEAKLISKYSGNIGEASYSLDEKNFSVDGATMIGTIGEYCDSINGVENEITTITSQIREIAEYRYNKIQGDLNYDAQRRDQNECEKRNRG